MKGLDWTTIIVAVMQLLGLIATSMIALYTRQIHTAVNSERTSTLDEIRALKAEVLKLSVEKAARGG